MNRPSEGATSPQASTGHAAPAPQMPAPRIALLEVALLEAADLVERTVISETQHDQPEDDPDWQAAQRWRALVGSGERAADTPPRSHCPCEGTGRAAGRFCRRRGCTAGRDLEARLRADGRGRRFDQMSRELRASDEIAHDRFADDGGRMFE